MEEWCSQSAVADVLRQRGQVDDVVTQAQEPSDRGGEAQLLLVPLAVVEADEVKLVTLVQHMVDHRGAVEAATNDGNTLTHSPSTPLDCILDVS